MTTEFPAYSPLAPSAYEGASRRYPWVRAFGRLNHEPEERIAHTQALLDGADAPTAAIWYFQSEREVLELDHVTNPETRLYFLDWAHAYEIALPYEVLKHWLDPTYAAPETSQSFWETP